MCNTDVYTLLLSQLFAASQPSLHLAFIIYRQAPAGKSELEIAIEYAIQQAEASAALSDIAAGLREQQAAPAEQPEQTAQASASSSSGAVDDSWSGWTERRQAWSWGEAEQQQQQQQQQGCWQKLEHVEQPQEEVQREQEDQQQQPAQQLQEEDEPKPKKIRGGKFREYWRERHRAIRENWSPHSSNAKL